MKSPEPPKGVQTLIHFLEEGAGKVWARRILALILLSLGVALYQFNEARNFNAPEAMDTAQLGRNLAAGRGYHTSFIRPLSLHLLQTRAVDRNLDPRNVLTQPHPDLQNPPLYPLLLAVTFKAMPATWWGQLPADEFRRRPIEEVAISMVNLGLFGGVLLLVLWLGQRLFDATAGWTAAAFTFGTEPLWNFANSGLPTLLLMFLGLVLTHVLLTFEREASQTEPNRRRLIWLAIGAGLSVALMFLTQYSFGWLLLPVMGFLIWRGLGVRLLAPLLALLFGLGPVTPWLVRNYQLSGQPFGTAGFAVLSGTDSFPGDRLERSQHPQFFRGQAAEVLRKVIVNLRNILRDDVVRLGGNWITVFFLVGLLIPFGNASLNRLRLFVLVSLVVLLVVQAAGQTWITTVFGPYTSENLLVVLAPLVFVFGTGFLLTLLDQIEWPAPLVRSLVVGCLLVAFSSPFLLSLLPPREFALRDPPYRPNLIREFADYTPPGTLFMSDIPWAVAWYGPRECVWATLRVQDSAEANMQNRREDFFVFIEARRPVEAVYISPFWANQPLRSRYLADADFAWGRFYLDVMLRGNLPSNFPLKNVLGGPYMTAGHFLLGAKDWWSQKER